MLANSKEGILYYKNYYERYGYNIELCSECSKIRKIVYPQESVSGPSISSGMMCECVDGFRKVLHEKINSPSRS